MKNEILNLLKREGMISDEIDDANINDFADLIEGIGRTEKEYIKSSEISKGLKTKYVGKNLYVFNEVGSTNTIAKFLSKNGIGNGSVVIAEKQTAGRGRSGKSWESPLGGIWLSIILTPDVDYSKIPLITLATGVAVAKTLEEIGIENPEIKWPNDIMVNGKKVCGILTEAITNFNTIEHVIIGVGIDANLSIEDFPEELQNTTTTLEREIGRVNENLLIKLFLEELEKIIELFNSKCYEDILKEWRKRSYTIGKMVEVKKPFSRSYDAYAAGISKEGELIVEKHDG
ncbi:MAG: biotin--[Methanobrevibacter sp.]|nr:biotin--[acetyl-CoA-carboxylase] ligase [Methanobrevibacter sp.]